jgi:hypothetical protein
MFSFFPRCIFFFWPYYLQVLHSIFLDCFISVSFEVLTFLSLFLLAKCKIAETLLKHIRIKQKSHTKKETGGFSVDHKRSEQIIGQQTPEYTAMWLPVQEDRKESQATSVDL